MKKLITKYLERNKVLTDMLKLSIVILLFFGSISLKSQNSLYVKETSNIQTIYGLSNVQKLTFNTGDMTVNEIGGNTDIYSLSGIRYLSFSDFTADISVNKEFTNVQLFPNPAREEINICLNSHEAVNLTIEIISIQGKILIRQVVNRIKGTTNHNINISDIPDGLYLCRLHYVNQYENIKFIKNKGGK